MVREIYCCVSSFQPALFRLFICLGSGFVLLSNHIFLIVNNKKWAPAYKLRTVPLIVCELIDFGSNMQLNCILLLLLLLLPDRLRWEAHQKNDKTIHHFIDVVFVLVSNKWANQKQKQNTNSGYGCKKSHKKMIKINWAELHYNAHVTGDLHRRTPWARFKYLQTVPVILQFKHEHTQLSILYRRRELS